MLAISFCWWHKPIDIVRPIIPETHTTIAAILTQVGTGYRSFRGASTESFIQAGRSARQLYEIHASWFCESQRNGTGTVSGCTNVHSFQVLHRTSRTAVECVRHRELVWHRTALLIPPASCMSLVRAMYVYDVDADK
jgi:hypothetical protein